MTPAPPKVDDREAVFALGETLRAAGYTSEAVEHALELDDGFERSLLDVPVYERLVPRGTAFGTLVELFLLGGSVPRADAERAVAPVALERLARAGIVGLADGSAQATVEIAPTEDFLLASDRKRRDAQRPDHVLGFSPPTRVLATLTVLEPVERALDVGTGSGYQALQAAGIAREVVGIDINPRALRFAAFNTALNGIGNVELREGSLFEPVADERFGLVVSNPPYVISPETDYVFRDSGLPGDSFCEALVRGLPTHLEEGGHGVALIAWTHRADEEPPAPVRRWLEGSGCDTLLFRYRSTDPAEYAAGWNQNLRHDRDAYAAALDRWLGYYEELGIERIAWGGIVLRRRTPSAGVPSSPPGRRRTRTRRHSPHVLNATPQAQPSGPPSWFWTHDPASSRIGSASDQILRLFRAQDFLRDRVRGAEPQRLLAARLALAEDHEFQETGRLDDDDAQGPVVLRLQTGFCFRLDVDRSTVALLALLDGRRTLGDAIAQLAAASRGVDPGQLAGVVVPAVRRLLELGFLVLVDDG